MDNLLELEQSFFYQFMTMIASFFVRVKLIKYCRYWYHRANWKNEANEKETSSFRIRFIYNLVATSSYKFGVIEYGIISNITADYILGSIISITLHEISRSFNMAATSAIEENIAINRMHISSRLELTTRKTRYLLPL